MQSNTNGQPFQLRTNANENSLEYEISSSPNLSDSILMGTELSPKDSKAILSRRLSRSRISPSNPSLSSASPILRTLRRRSDFPEESNLFAHEDIGFSQNSNLRHQLTLQVTNQTSNIYSVPSSATTEHRGQLDGSHTFNHTNLNKPPIPLQNRERHFHSSINYLQGSKPFQIFVHAVVLLVDAFYLLLYFLEIGITLNRKEPLIENKYPPYLWIPRPYNMWIVLLSLSAITTLFSLLRLSLHSVNIFSFLFSLPTIIDLITATPFLVLLFIKDGRFFYVPYFLRSLLILPRLRRVLHLQMLLQDFSDVVNPLRERFVTLIGTIFVIFIITLCCVHFTEVVMDRSNLDIVSLIYFVTVTLSTVGYGDISVQTTLGRLVIVVSIFVSIASFSSLVSSALEAWRDSKKGSGWYSPTYGKHIVIIGNVTNPASALDLLRNLFHKKIGLELRVVVLGRRKLLKEVKSVFNSPFFKDRVTFLQGSALNHHDLTRAQVARAQGVFILSCRSNTDDERNVLRVWAITNYSPSVPIYVYIYNSYYAQYIDNFVTSRICVHDLKQTILACNALHKGISTLITNLITPAIPLERYPSQWQVQYGDGTNNQIVELETRSFYIGLSFKEVAAFLFEVSNIILFAVRTITLNGSEHVLINPAEKYKLSGLENLICIAQNLEEIDKVNKMSEKEFQKVFSGKFQSYEHASNIIPLSPPPFLYEKKNHNSSNYDVMEPITFITTEGLVRAQPLNSYHGTKVPLCFIKLKPFATFQDVLLKQTRLSGHIVVFANTWELFWFFCTLRSIHIPISEQRPILIFTRNLPTKEEFKLLSVFPSFFILQGNFKQRHDLLMAQIHLAHSVVIFSSESTHPDSDGTDRSEFMDLDAIMLCHLIKKIINEMSSHPVQVVIELQAREALKYLSPTPRPQTDLRTSQIYPNEALTKKPQNSNTFYHPLYASGEGFISSMLDNLLFQDFFNPAILNIVNQLSGVRSAVDELYDKEFEVDPSNLSLIPLPKEFDKKSFRYLFHEFCMKYGIIPLGLYRAPSRSLENQEPFVYTGPFPETILRKTDEVFILTRGWGSLGPNSYSLNEKDE